MWAPSNDLTFIGNSHFQNLPILHPGETAKFTIKLWLDGPSAIYEIKPVIDVYPVSANSHVKLETDTLDHLDPNTAGTFHVTITTDPEIPTGKIFLSASFVAKDNYGKAVKGGWSERDSWINVEQFQQSDSLAKQLEQARQKIEQAKFVSDYSLMSPLKQFRSGILLTNIECKDGFQLIIKSENGLPACVAAQTAKKLGEHGWGKDLSNILLEIPLPKISQIDAIKTVENDLKNHVKNSTKILKIVDAIGDQQKYVPFSEFQTNNKTLPLVFVSTNGTLLTINDASLRIHGWCNIGVYAYCAYMPPFNLDYKSRLVYGLDIVYGENDAHMEPAFYAVDATSGNIVDSSFLRNEARENNTK